ncbi:MAG: YqaJ viral recombinase family protein [Candidatus Eisenbacteria bacterium]|nr:YqaJ viral recombinase family protein [Candidatus Eisenbacteria bacterium]
MRPYKVVQLEQNTPAWHEWRQDGIGASEARMIARGRGSKSWDRLLDQKCAREEGFSGTDAMRRGHELEPKARARFEHKVGLKVRPACLQSIEHEWLRCSVDGLSHDGTRVVEIKCGSSLYDRVAEASTFPKDLFAQLQHILAVTGLRSVDFFCHWPGRKDIHQSVARHQEWIDCLIAAEYDFWREVCRQRR